MTGFPSATSIGLRVLSAEREILLGAVMYQISFPARFFAEKGFLLEYSATDSGLKSTGGL